MEVFEQFALALSTNARVSVTRENAAALSQLASEFCLYELLSECSTVMSSLLDNTHDEFIFELSERISKLEHDFVNQQASFPILSRLENIEQVQVEYNEAIEQLASEISSLEANLAAIRSELATIHIVKPRRPSDPSHSPNHWVSARQSEMSARPSVDAPGIAAHPSSYLRSLPRRPNLHGEINFPLVEANSLDGIISYLTHKHAGNVHD
jgi:hypothetical protein